MIGYDEICALLRSAGCVFAEDEAALILAEATTAEAAQRMVSDRVAGVPLEQILGWAEFDALRIVVAPGVFVPRRRSSLLVRLAVAHVRSDSVVVDLCCGTGALAAAILAQVPEIDAYAADLDPAATACARSNLPHDRVFEGDLFAALPAHLRGRIDALVVNAPYVPTDAIGAMPPEARDHEHRVALDGGADGLDVQRRVIAVAPGWLTADGLLVLETGADQAPVTAGLVRAAGLTAEIVTDPGVAGTAVTGRPPGGQEVV